MAAQDQQRSHAQQGIPDKLKGKLTNFLKGNGKGILDSA
jgi:hypothetical protein